MAEILNSQCIDEGNVRLWLHYALNQTLKNVMNEKQIELWREKRKSLVEMLERMKQRAHVDDANVKSLEDNIEALFKQIQDLKKQQKEPIQLPNMETMKAAKIAIQALFIYIGKTTINVTKMEKKCHELVNTLWETQFRQHDIKKKILVYPSNY